VIRDNRVDGEALHPEPGATRQHDGIARRDADNVTIEQDTIVAHQTNGIDIRSWNETAIQHNLVRANGQDGIGLHAANRVTVEANVIVDNDDGIEQHNTARSTDVTVRSNAITGHTNDAVIFRDAVDVRVHDNRLSANDDGVCGLAVDEATIRDNTVTANDRGIPLVRESQIAIDQNTIADNQYLGVLLDEITGISFTHNKIANNTIGIEERDTWTLDGSTDVAIHDNDIHANEDAGLTTDTRAVVDACDHW